MAGPDSIHLTIQSLEEEGAPSTDVIYLELSEIN